MHFIYAKGGRKHIEKYTLPYTIWIFPTILNLIRTIYRLLIKTKNLWFPQLKKNSIEYRHTLKILADNYSIMLSNSFMYLGTP